jgi:membrane protein DedA with SNARE-associated domain
MAHATGLSSLSGPAALVLLLPMEAGIPIPLPADLVMFTVGERVGAGKIPLWLAVGGFAVVAVAGTAALFLACRGPAQRVIARFGPRASGSPRCGSTGRPRSPRAGAAPGSPWDAPLERLAAG